MNETFFDVERHVQAQPAPPDPAEVAKRIHKLPTPRQPGSYSDKAHAFDCGYHRCKDTYYHDLEYKATHAHAPVTGAEQVAVLGLEAVIKTAFPHGHPAFAAITLQELELHSAKNHDYAQGGSPLGNFQRVATILRQYPDLDLSDQRVVLLVYMLKQFDAILWGLNQNIQHKVEGLVDRMRDVSVYGKIFQCMCRDLEATK